MYFSKKDIDGYRKCVFCGSKFEPTNSREKYCPVASGKSCKQKATYRNTKNRKKGQKKPKKTGSGGNKTTGAFLFYVLKRIIPTVTETFKDSFFPLIVISTMESV